MRTLKTRRAIERNFRYHAKNRSLRSSSKENFSYLARTRLPQCLVSNQLLNQERHLKFNECASAESKDACNELIMSLMQNARNRVKTKSGNEYCVEQENNGHTKAMRKRVKIARRLTKLTEPRNTSNQNTNKYHKATGNLCLPVTKATLYYGVSKSNSLSKRVEEPYSESQEEMWNLKGIKRHLPDQPQFYPIPQFRIVMKRNTHCNRSFM
eukprot:TRINITY_DN343_c1_g1_i1.p1 TRINITY_DN343_c1_g1~~TRINITY_DN343_c1_g1_i1.p1  ORF type:complete len:211 (+),score=20.42 TRINITY_DN343_c1_g1_i1:27-659(+)